MRYHNVRHKDQINDTKSKMVQHFLIKKGIVPILSVNINICLNNIYKICNVKGAEDFFPGVVFFC